MYTERQIRKAQNGMRKVEAALRAGRTLSVYNSVEFEQSEMHTAFCKIRKKIAKGQIQGFSLCSRWATNAEGIRYKQYWFEVAE